MLRKLVFSNQKMILMVLAIVWHFTVQRRWTNAESVGKSKTAAICSILLWTAVGAAGKGIPYV